MITQTGIGLIGTVTYDVITSDAGDVYRGLGGILYQAAVLSVLEKNVFLFTNLGRDLAGSVEKVIGHFPALQKEGIQYVPGPGNHVHLHYPEQGERREILRSVVPPLDPQGVLQSLDRLQMLVSVLNSGFDITLSDWRRIVDAAICPVWLDLHSFVLSRELNVPRKYLSNIPWENWTRGVTYLQANRAELGCLVGLGGQGLSDVEIKRFGRKAFNLGLRAVFITLGRDGVWVLTPGSARLIVPSHADNVEDTTGCGDVFCAVTVKGLVDGADPFSAAEAGVELATRATAVKGVEETITLVRRAISGCGHP
ncbi:MAG: PfkB family carbohydrate kinase [Candidatus Aminicenantaceae bacterium]